MGGSSWSDDDYVANVTYRTNTKGVSSFDHDHDIRRGVTTAKVHKSLDPAVLGDVKMRESRDSTAHPTSNAIMVGLDVTGSMSSVVRQIHENLPKLMGILTRKNYIPDPQIMFVAIGDAYTDTSPLQVGQFESGAEMETDLSNFHLEGGGGGQKTESYELFAYVGARKTSIDCFEKRSKKGYCFIVGDEMPYPRVNKDQVNHLIGAGLEADVNTQEIFRELQQKYTVFFILPKGASHGGDKEISSKWKEILGNEHVLELSDPSGVSELIAMQIGLCEGVTDVDAAAKDLEEHGTSKALVNIVRSSVSKAYDGGAMTKVSPGTLSPSTDTGSVKRL
jgi:hypothetical protein